MHYSSHLINHYYPYHDAKDASEMKISGPTLIKFNNNKIDDYIEGKDEITDYLK